MRAALGASRYEVFSEAGLAALRAHLRGAAAAAVAGAAIAYVGVFGRALAHGREARLHMLPARCEALGAWRYCTRYTKMCPAALFGEGARVCLDCAARFRGATPRAAGCSGGGGGAAGARGVKRPGSGGGGGCGRVSPRPRLAEWAPAPAAGGTVEGGPLLGGVGGSGVGLGSDAAPERGPSGSAGSGASPRSALVAVAENSQRSRRRSRAACAAAPLDSPRLAAAAGAGGAAGASGRSPSASGGARPSPPAGSAAAAALLMSLYSPARAGAAAVPAAAAAAPPGCARGATPLGAPPPAEQAASGICASDALAAVDELRSLLEAAQRASTVAPEELADVARAALAAVRCGLEAVAARAAETKGSEPASPPPAAAALAAGEGSAWTSPS